MQDEKLALVAEWDNTFLKDKQAAHKKVAFHNRYGITLATDVYTPPNVHGPLPTLAVCGPFGAVKEQASGLYAQTIALHGFYTMAFDPLFRRGKRGPAALHGFAGHQHRGFSGRC